MAPGSAQPERPTAPHPVRFSFYADEPADGPTCRLSLEGRGIGERHASFTPPYDLPTLQALLQALEPGFDPAEADPSLVERLAPLGDPARLPQTVGDALGAALLAGESIRQGFHVALTLAQKARHPLPVELRFGPGTDLLAALPWELLRYRDRFLVAENAILLSRYPEEAIPPTPAQADLPLRVLLVLAEPVDAPATLSQEARKALLEGLRRLDEEGAVVVDLLRPPTYDALLEALTEGEYHLLLFYGHGGRTEAGEGQLLFEDEYGGADPVPADLLGAALRNTTVRLVVLGACRSAQTLPPAPATEEGPPPTGGLWSSVAPALLRAGVPLAVGMQTSMRVDAALAFLRHFALALATGRTILEAVGLARKPLLRRRYGHVWFIPALYGRPADGYRLFDPQAPRPAEGEALREALRRHRAEVAALEAEVERMGVLGEPTAIARLREARTAFAQARAALARRTPGRHTPPVSLLYGVPTNPLFVGRARELQEVARGLAGEHPVVVWGAPGIGKTALAAEVAHRQGWRFPAGVLWLDCQGGPELGALLERIGAFCGLAMDQVRPEEREEAVRRALARLEGRYLLIWDNAETVWGREPVRRFIKRLPPNGQALLTTREDPHQPMWRTVELAPLGEEAAGRLFWRLAVAAGARLERRAVEELLPRLLAHLEGHPLALTLVVPLVKRRGLRRVWEDLQARPLAGLKGVEAAFALSYDRLTPFQQRLFTRLSLFTIPVEAQAAEALLGPEEAPRGPDGVLEALDRLVDGALVTFDGARYRFHPLLRRYAYEKLKEREDPRPLHRRAAAYLEEKAATGVTPEERLESVDQWERGEAWEEFVRSARALVGSLDRLGYWEAIEARLRRALEVAEARRGEAPVAAAVRNDLAVICFRQGRWGEAQALWEQALERFEELGDRHGAAQTLGNLGNVYFRQGAWDRAIAFYRQALERFEELGDRHGAAQTLGNLGTVYAQQGAWDRAIAFYRQALEIEEELGDRHGAAKTYNNLGTVYADKGEWNRAIAFYRRSLEIKEELGDRHGAAQTLGNLGLVYADKGEWDRAIAFYRRSLEIKEELGDRHGAAATYNNLGEVHRRQGAWDRAIAFYRQALERFQELGDLLGTALVWLNVGLLYLETDRSEEAGPLLAHAYLILAQLGSPEAEKAAAALVRACGSVEAANTCLAQVVEQPGEDTEGGMRDEG